MLKVVGVSKTYFRQNQEIKAVDHLSLTIPAGDFVSIIGPSGSGKSSLLLMLGGMLSPSSGQVFVDGVSLYDLTPNDRSELRKKKMGFVFQTFNLIPYLTAIQKRPGASDVSKHG